MDKETRNAIDYLLALKSSLSPEACISIEILVLGLIEATETIKTMSYTHTTN
jgi:hypothetical protein